ncbi:UNVERIFIED_CONTAM: hypothetical protein FKN15_067168 [Acipenser sinensis]
MSLKKERPKRNVKLTEKAVDEKTAKLKNARKAKLAQLTSTKNVIQPLFEFYQNSLIIRKHMKTFNDLAKDFIALHRSVQELLSEEKRAGP